MCDHIRLAAVVTFLLLCLMSFMIQASELLSFDIRMDGLYWGRLTLQSGLVGHISHGSRFFFIGCVADSSA